jgi:hypothetical protein
MDCQRLNVKPIATAGKAYVETCPRKKCDKKTCLLEKKIKAFASFAGTPGGSENQRHTKQNLP